MNLNDDLVKSFEDGTLNIREFDHKQHVYVAWRYLKGYGFKQALERYVKHLCVLLHLNGALRKFSLSITEDYFHLLAYLMRHNPAWGFDDVFDMLKK